MMLTQPRGEAAVAAALGALASYVLWEAQRMPAGTPGQPGPGFFPTILGVALLACSIVLLARWWTQKSAAPAVTISLRHRKIWITLAALVAVPCALEPLGFAPTASVFLVVLLRWCGDVSWRASIAGALLMSAAAWYFFVAALGVALPRGVLPL
jgi:putative tricarboxylic transport membrane protein